MMQASARPWLAILPAALLVATQGCLVDVAHATPLLRAAGGVSIAGFSSDGVTERYELTLQVQDAVRIAMADLEPRISPTTPGSGSEFQLAHTAGGPMVLPGDVLRVAFMYHPDAPEVRHSVRFELVHRPTSAELAHVVYSWVPLGSAAAP